MGCLVRERAGGWWVLASHAGKRRARSCGPGRSGRALAERVAVQWRAWIALDQAERIWTKPARAEPLTFAHVARRWLVEYPALHPIRQSTFDNYRSFVRIHLIPALGSMALADVTPAQIERMIASKRPALADSSLRTGLVALRLILKRAARDKLIPANPMIDLEWRGSARPDSVDPFTGYELRQILAAAQEIDTAFATLLRMWAQCGARAGEMAGLQWPDVDMVHGRVTIRRTYSHHRLGPPKTGRERTISFLHPVLDELGDWRPGSSTSAFGLLEPLRRMEQAALGPFVFGRAQPIRSGQAHRLWRRVLARASVRYRAPEQLRHTLASTLLSRGAPLLYVQSVGGWRSASVLLGSYAR